MIDWATWSESLQSSECRFGLAFFESESGLVAYCDDGRFTTTSHDLQAFKTYVLNAIACNIKPHEVVIG